MKKQSNNNGQAVTEYLLILAVVVAGALTLTRLILTGIDDGVLVVGGQLEKNLKTGRAPITIWGN